MAEIEVNRRAARETYRRYEWSRPGALLHVDVARLARFNRPGHAVTGVRDLTGAEKLAGVGYVYLHCVIDDHSRHAYVEQHPDQGGDTEAAVLGRAIEHFASLGMNRATTTGAAHTAHWTTGRRAGFLSLDRLRIPGVNMRE